MVLKHLVAEVAFELGRDLLLERHAGVEHDPQQADDRQVAVEVGVPFLIELTRSERPSRA